MRSHFDEQLAQLSRELTEMGALCEEVIALSAKALTDGDKALAARVAPLDAEIDQKERDIESLCLKLLLQQQPVARDLRQISRFPWYHGGHVLLFRSGDHTGSHRTVCRQPLLYHRHRAHPFPGE